MKGNIQKEKRVTAEMWNLGAGIIKIELDGIKVKGYIGLRTGSF